MTALVFAALLASPQQATLDSVRYLEIVSAADTAYVTRDYEKAESLINEALAISDSDGRLWQILGMSRMRLGKHQSAVAAFERQLSLGTFENKDQANAHYNIACAWALGEEKEQAFAALQRAMDLGFRSLPDLRADEDLESLHSDPRWIEIAALKDVSQMSRDEAWRYDWWLLDREVRRIHIDPYQVTPKATFDQLYQKLHDEIPDLTDNQIRVRMMQYVRLFGDGHTRISPGGGFTRVPIGPYWFKEGLFINSAAEDYSDLLGAEILEVEGRAVRDLLPIIDTICFQDNPQGALSASPGYYTIPGALEGLGVIPAKEEISYRLRLRSGEVVNRTLTARPMEPTSGWKVARELSDAPVPLYYQHTDKPYWFEHLPEEKLLYFQYNSVRSDPSKSIARTAAEMAQIIAEEGVEYLVVDARFNGGGNSFLNRPFVHMILNSPQVNKKGHLFVITGRHTFSAAHNFITDIGREANPLFVGEPSGSRPNFVGESIPLELPYSKMRGSISDLYWQRSWPMDGRMWISPDLPAPPSIRNYMENRDPAMEAIMAYIRRA